MNYKIRQLEEVDFIDGSGFVETMANMSNVGNLNFDQLKAIWQKAKQQDAYFFVALSQEGDAKDQIIATVKLLIEPKYFHGGRAAGHIEDVVTRKGYEGNGLAKALLKEAIKTAEENNCYKVILDCSEKLTSFYEKSGFAEHSVCMRLDFKK